MDKIFTDGFYLNTVSEKAPPYIITNQDIHVEKAIAWLLANKHLANEKGYIKLTGKESQQGKRYFEVDTWKPTNTTETPENAISRATRDSTAYPEPLKADEIPF